MKINMMKFFLTISLLALPLLTACGFHPVYGVNKYTAIGAEERLEQIHIENIPNREGQYLRNALIDRFYRNARPVAPKYNLNISTLSESSRDLDITIDSDTTRGQLTLKTTMMLTDQKTGEALIKRNLRSIASYNIIQSEFANRVSEQNTRENALDDLARQIEEQIALYFKQNL